ncbi:uncharacterized protein BDR25DRAFT_275194 [Lindgomyces ingoldianus]|uniref:Uncharacterized protein n=1 Tax=Lindgomyces ingoldianus TaxID=673940 RepID=A0ACB6RF80_9PLEO|nr:uncharacterized protein BDR25DRAFT_275194 [Lindgomyces ingoldianus]KAF2477791.1 hypothetical protein BDR25DRAFT_275194 [Lindgomyces ingoldianus]
MDPTTAPQLHTDSASDYGSDISLSPAQSKYGSEFDLEEAALIGNLLTQIAATAPTIEGNEAQVGECLDRPFSRRPLVEVEYDSLSSKAWSVPKEDARPDEQTELAKANPGQSKGDTEDDTRSPLERFRTQPMKPLSVTDLVSPAWCELQYWYILTKFGRKPRTTAMKKGSEVHRVLEEQVHEIRWVQVKSKEDRFGLKIWNTIQGLRTLKETGLTRELEVWGIIGGQVVNGIIDEISYMCPDTDLEESPEKSKVEKAGGTLPLGRPSIAQGFNNSGNNPSAWVGSLKPERLVYIADIKTRGGKSVPARTSLRPTWMQLMLYRKLLEDLALNVVDGETVFGRYGLDPLEPFTEVFMLEVGSLGTLETIPEGKNAFGILQASEIECHGNLSALWSLMISEFGRSIDTFSDVLRAEFRSSKTGELIGSEFTIYDASVIEKYTLEELSWWKGEREAKGVEIEEAYKCKVCDFAETCTWRKLKIQEATEKHRLRGTMKRKLAV